MKKSVASIILMLITLASCKQDAFERMAKLDDVFHLQGIINLSLEGDMDIKVDGVYYFDGHPLAAVLWRITLYEVEGDKLPFMVKRQPLNRDEALEHPDEFIRIVGDTLPLADIKAQGELFFIIEEAPTGQIRLRISGRDIPVTGRTEEESKSKKI